MLNFTIQLTAFNSTTLKEEKINSQSENCRNWWNSLQSGDLFSRHHTLSYDACHL